MLRTFEDGAAIGALAFEHAARIMQAMSEHVQSSVTPRHQLAIVPDHAIEPIVGLFSHGAPPAARWALHHPPPRSCFCVAGHQPVFSGRAPGERACRLHAMKTMQALGMI